MERKIRVHFSGRNDTAAIEVGLEEAMKILTETYSDPVGGLVVNKETGEVIVEISPDVKELLIIDHIVGGG